MTEIVNYNEKIFESIRHIDKHGKEFWYARELQTILEYKRWDRFFSVIEKAKISCEASNNNVFDHFSNVGKMVDIGVSSRNIGDIKLSRYACYLIAQNGDPRKKAIALAQTYFAIKTRQQELTENYNVLSKEQKRLAIRSEIAEHNKSLADSANKAGVCTSKEYAIFQNKGYQGLYGGLGAKEIHKKKGLKKSQKILDHMGSTELAANLFRATQTDEKLRRENIKGKEKAYQTHFEVGKKVRQTIKELGGTMPEDLPTPKKSIKEIEKEHQNLIK